MVGEQGVPILVHLTRASEQQSKRLLRMSIKEAHLTSDIADPSAVHTTQDSAIELSQQARHRASAGLTGIFT